LIGSAQASSAFETKTNDSVAMHSERVFFDCTEIAGTVTKTKELETIH